MRPKQLCRGLEVLNRVFQRLEETLNDTNDEVLKQKLSAIVARRDEITTNMAARADSSVKEKLAQMFADLFKMTAVVTRVVNVGTAPRIVQKLEEIIRLAKQVSDYTLGTHPITTKGTIGSGGAKRRSALG